MIIVLHGDNEFDRSEHLRQLKAGLGEYDDLNLVELDGRSLTPAILQDHADVPPFLGDQRMVVVHGLLTRLTGGRGAKKADASFLQWLCTYVPTVPDTTTLILVEIKLIPARNPLLRAVQQLGERGRVLAFRAPGTRGNELERWVVQHAAKLGAQLGHGVAADLASYIGPDLRLIHSELLKLMTYAGDRPISRDDVRLLTPYAQQANIFAMVDALGHQQTAEAFRLLSRLRNQGAHPLYLLTMIVRQFRILLQVHELSSQGLQQGEIASRLKLNPFVVKKAIGQARRYSRSQLMQIYDKLLEVDVAIKTGKMEANLALDLLVVELARP